MPGIGSILLCLLLFAASTPTFLIGVWHLSGYVHENMQPPGREVKEHDAVLITGASRGVGKYTALFFNRKGFTVYAGVRRAEDVQALKAVAVNQDKMVPMILDVTSDSDVEAVRKVLEEGLGGKGLSVYINTAGAFPNSGEDEDGISSAVDAMPTGEYENMVEVNVYGMIRVVKMVIPFLEQAHAFDGRRAKVFLTCDDFMRGFSFASAAYDIRWGKSAVIQILRRELDDKRTGVDVSGWLFGWVRTQLLAYVIRNGVVKPDLMGKKYANPNELGAARMGISYMADALHPREVSERMLREALSPWTRTRIDIATVALFRAMNYFPVEYANWLAQSFDPNALHIELQPEVVKLGAEWGLTEYIPQADGTDKAVVTSRPDVLPDGWYEQWLPIAKARAEKAGQLGQ